MKTYTIGTPGGYDVEVRAASDEEALALVEKNWEAMPRVIFRGEGDVRVLRRSNGQTYLVSPSYSTTDPERIRQVLESGRIAGEVSRDAIDNELIDRNPVAARAAAFNRGAPVWRGWFDDAIGGVFGEDAKIGAQALSGAMERQRPGENLALNVAGAATGTAALAAALPRLAGAGFGASGGATRLAQAARAIPRMTAAGGAEGALAGAGEGRLLQEAGYGLLGGAIAGAASPYMDAAIKNIAGRIARSDIVQIAREFNISQQAAKVLRNIVDQGGDLAGAMERLKKAGGEAMLVDMGEGAQALVDAAAATGGRAAATARTAIDGRMSRTQKALTAGLDAQLGRAPVGPESAMRDIAARSAPAREAAYGLAYGQQIDWTADSGQRLISVLNRVEPGMKLDAIRAANAILRDEGLMDELIDFDPSMIGPQRPMTVRQLDALKKALGEAAQRANTAYSNVPGKVSPDGRRLGGQASDLGAALGDNVGPYRDAVRIGGDKIAEENAFTAGRTALGTGTEVEDVLLSMGDTPSRDALASGKAGLRMAFQKLMGDVRGLASDPLNPEAQQVIAALKAASSDNVKAKVAAILGPDEAAKLYKQFDKAAQSAIVSAALARNSKTAVRGAIQNDVADITAPGPLGTLMRGDPINTSKQLIQIVTGMTDEYTAEQRQRIFADIARTLTERRGDQARAALGFLQRAMNGEQLRQEEVEALAREISAGLRLGGTTAATAERSAEERR